MDVPVIDLGGWFSGDTAARARVVKQWADAFETIGFATIVRHGVDEALLDRIHAGALSFFDQPLEIKRTASFPGEQASQGYVPMGVETVARTMGEDVPPDLCESLSFAYLDWEDGPPDNAFDQGLHRPNRWPAEPAGLRDLVLEYHRSVYRLGRQLMGLSAAALDLPEDHFAPRYDRMATHLRLVHYPDQKREPLPGQLRYGAHTNYTGFTILRQDDAPGGLQVLDPGGRWVDVPPVRGALVINAGDLLMRWTNHRWKSNLHRVVNPPRALTGSTRRLSIVLFTGPNNDAVIECLPTCRSADEPARYGPIKAHDHLMERIRASMPEGLEA